MTASADERRLVFVYNVDASPVAMLKDLYTGLTTGSTDCHLCDLTFGRLLKDRSWQRFVDELPIPVDFRMRSTFLADHPELRGARFPAAYQVDADGTSEVLTADAIDAADDLDALRSLVSATVARLVDETDR